MWVRLSNDSLINLCDIKTIKYGHTIIFFNYCVEGKWVEHREQYDNKELTRRDFEFICEVIKKGKDTGFANIDELLKLAKKIEEKRN